MKFVKVEDSPMIYYHLNLNEMNRKIITFYDHATINYLSFKMGFLKHSVVGE